MKNKPKILIVDDKFENLVALERILADMDVEFVRAMSGNEALAKTLENDLAIALLDVQMPEMDGFETVYFMRQDQRVKQLPIIFISAIYTEDYHQIKGIETGAIDFITKPVNPDILRGKVRIFLELYEYKRSLEEQNGIITSSHNDLEQALSRLEKAHEELTRSHEQLLQSQKLAAIGKLVSGVAHEVNNPLMAISGHAQLLLEDVEDEATKESLDVIYSETKRATDIVQNLLSFARTQKSKRSHVCINDLIESIAKLRTYGLPKSNIEIMIEFDPYLPKIEVDSQQLKQVFLNLINNATQAMKDEHGKGKLAIQTCRANDETVQISFVDDGPGISPEIIDRIFEPFFTTKDIGKGTGLGLSICYGIIQSHGGKIRAESIDGKGATFTVELPITNDELELAFYEEQLEFETVTAAGQPQ
ncbi:MAG: response regulator [Chloroflexi bacterium]|jgi:signal transduction histidine kinase|nr:response regulator [Chloroflexota bacterium]